MTTRLDMDKIAKGLGADEEAERVVRQRPARGAQRRKLRNSVGEPKR